MSEHPFISEVSASKLHAALVAIQELHKPVKVLAGWTRCSCNLKDNMGLSVLWPCPTRKLADEALGGRERG